MSSRKRKTPATKKPAKASRENGNTTAAVQHMVEKWVRFAIFNNSPMKKRCATKKADLAHAFHYSQSPELASRLKSVQQLRTAIARGLENATSSVADVDGDQATAVASQCNVRKEAAQSFAQRIEMVLFWTYFPLNRAAYYSKVSEIVHNMRENAMLLLSRYGPELVCFLGAESLADGTTVQRWRDGYKALLVTQLTRKRPQKCGIYSCPKCRKNNTDYFELQTRSADEPATIFVTCLDCNIMFKRG